VFFRLLITFCLKAFSLNSDSFFSISSLLPSPSSPPAHLLEPNFPSKGFDLPLLFVDGDGERGESTSIRGVDLDREREEDRRYPRRGLRLSLLLRVDLPVLRLFRGDTERGERLLVRAGLCRARRGGEREILREGGDLEWRGDRDMDRDLLPVDDGSFLARLAAPLMLKTFEDSAFFSLSTSIASELFLRSREADLLRAFLDFEGGVRERLFLDFTTGVRERDLRARRLSGFGEGDRVGLRRLLFAFGGGLRFREGDARGGPRRRGGDREMEREREREGERRRV